MKNKENLKGRPVNARVYISKYVAKSQHFKQLAIARKQ